MPIGSACLTYEQVAELVDGLAAPEEEALLTEHIAGCATCAGLASALRAARTHESFEELGRRDEILSRGARVGRYEILELIGAGAMGVVYAAHDPALDWNVALKLIRTQVAGPELETRLLREAKAMARLSHPDVITVHDAGMEGDRLFIAMELIDGGTLRDWLAQAPRSWREILAVYVRAAHGLARAHEAGIVHRDFKPDNVLIGKDGRVRVTDFGLARSVAGEVGGEVTGASAPPALGSGRTLDAPLTQTGTLIGTPVYMAPEQLLGSTADARSDSYSFCVALYEALHGERPFGGRTLLEQVLEKEAVAIRAPPADRAVPSRVRSVVVAGLRARPEERYASMEDLLRALERAAKWPLVAPRPSVAAVGAVLVGVAIATGSALVKERRHTAPASQPGGDSTEAAIAALAGPSPKLACPIFETRGVSDVGARLGAAAGTLACLRASWELGGAEGTALPPAALLDLPHEPVDGFADPYAAPGQRARTLDAARRRAAAYLDGEVTWENDSFAIELVLRAPDDREIARRDVVGKAFLPTLRSGLQALWVPPLPRREIDPETARWTSLPDTETGLLVNDLLLLDSTAGCARFGERRVALGNAFYPLRQACAKSGSAVSDGGAPELDDSSPQALVTSVRALAAWQIPIPLDDERRIATELVSLRDAETSTFARARLGYTAGLLWSLANDREPAQAALLASLKEDPLNKEAWELVVGDLGGLTGSAAAASAVASAWFPNEPRFVKAAGSRRGDELDARLRDARLAYLIEPGLVPAMRLGRALAEAGRATDARAVAATSLGDAESDRVLGAFVLGFIDLHDAKLARAITHLEDAGSVALVDLVVAAEVAGRADEVSTRWATRFLALPEDEAGAIARGYDTPMLLCMRAPRDLATRCLDRIERAGREAINWWYEGGTALLGGARRYVAGDLHGAVTAWRPLVAGPEIEIARALPTDVFERTGELDLAARLDARKMPFTFINGVSDAAPREARRAMAAGDTARARELARAVVQGWEIADLDVPAVARMRALLESTSRAPR